MSERLSAASMGARRSSLRPGLGLTRAGLSKFSLAMRSGVAIGQLMVIAGAYRELMAWAAQTMIEPPAEPTPRRRRTKRPEGRSPAVQARPGRRGAPRGDADQSLRLCQQLGVGNRARPSKGCHG
jgi:hypothetical protein